ncbi:MAG: GNAT family acetyltransferase [Parvibaculaceae bacterium]
MSATLDFRPIANGDVEEVVALWEACGLTRPWNDPAKDIAFARGKPSSEILVARQDGEIAASVMVGHDGHRGTVYYVSVSPRARGRGHGRQAMQAAEAWLRARGVWKLNLLIREDNETVRAFYERLGYGAEPRIVMARKLDEDPA